MLIEKDLGKIKLLGERNERQNYKFRLFLKNIDLASSEIDKMVHEIYEHVRHEIDCTECANCCKQFTPLLDENDITRFIKKLDMDAADFKSRYLQEVKAYAERATYEFRELPCPFLLNNTCSNYQNRPNPCRGYPYLHRKDFRSRLLSVIENYSICPIVFNVFELLKNNFRRY
jgi:Fe-S-cluster containining protein